MADSGFQCESCGRRFRWKPTLAGKRVSCRCGEAITIPAQAPPPRDPSAPGSSSGYELADTAAAAASPRAAAPKCVQCNIKLKPGTVICIGCGTDQRTGKQQTTATLPPDEAAAEPGERYGLGADGGRPDAVTGDVRRKDDPEERDAYRGGGMVALEVGLWCELVSIVLTVLALVGLVVAAFLMDPDELVLWGTAAVVLPAVLSVAAYILMLAVPSEAKARWLIGVALALLGGEVALGVAAADSLLWSTVGGVLGFLSTVFFLAFLRELANFFGFQEIIENADKVLVLFVILSVGQFIFWLPAFGIFMLIIMALYLGYAIYTFILYVSLLVDLVNSARYRRQHGGPNDGIIR